jgi:hypothetical protein
MLPARALEWAITTDRTALLAPSKHCVVKDVPPVEAPCGRGRPHPLSQRLTATMARGRHVACPMCSVLHEMNRYENTRNK